MPPDGDSHAECRPVDIQLYTWLGSGFESGECWHQGYRFLNGATWGQTNIPGAPYCVCEQGQVRIFYSQKKAEKPAAAADSLTLLRPFHGSSPTSQDLAKWPIPDIFNAQLRSVICSNNRLETRVRSRDGCVGCKCSTNGHWLCRKPPTLKRNRTSNSRQGPLSSKNNQYPKSDSSNSVNVQLRVTSLRVQPQCPLGTIPQYCILIERISSANISETSSRFIEIPREASWTDHHQCTQCSCTRSGQLTCQTLHTTCNRSCLVHKTQSIPLTYYFPSGSKWLTPPNDKCRLCMCTNGQRKCINCDQILKINIGANAILNNTQQRPAIGEYRLLSPQANAIKTTPCVLQISFSSHRLILPGQRTWFEQRCYLCSKRHGRLISC